MLYDQKEIKKNIKRLEKLRREALGLRAKLRSIEEEIDKLVREIPLP